MKSADRKMPKVLFLKDGLENGGAERQFALLIKYLPLGWERCVWSLHGGPFTPIIQDTGVKVVIHERIGRFDIRPAFDLWRTIITFHPDVVHSWGWMCTLLAAGVCNLFHIPLIDGTIRNGMVSPRHEGIRRWSMKSARYIIANSQSGLDSWRIDSNKGRVIHNGFDHNRFPTSQINKINNNAVTTVIMTGRMSRQKDFHTFLKAAHLLLAQNNQSWRFIALGNGPDREGLITEAKELIEAGQFSFPEPNLEVLDLVSQSNIGVLMSNPSFHAEGCSNSIMEYMACGLPVVCSESGGNNELVIDRESGFIIPPLNPIALVDKLLWLKNNPAESLYMGKNGRERILNDFSVKTMVNKTLSVYAEAYRKSTSE
jgi:glycosyltransferase involved in cell wall biosynthesis